MYHASDTTLHTHFDASNLGETYRRSRVAGFLFLGMISTSPINGGHLNRSSILDVVVSSAAEAELGDLFENMRDVTSLRAEYSDGHGLPQPASLMQTDNKCADGCGIAHDNTVKS